MSYDLEDFEDNLDLDDDNEGTHEHTCPTCGEEFECVGNECAGIEYLFCDVCNDEEE